jgi:hypothetical protein
MASFFSAPAGGRVLVNFYPHISDLAHTLRFLALRLMAALERFQPGDFLA